MPLYKAKVAYQVIEDVLLVDVDGDKSFKLCSFSSRQFLGRDVDQLIENVDELVVSCRHQALVVARILQRRLRLCRPYHLQT